MPKMFQCYQNWIVNRKIIIDVLAIFFGIGAWVGVNGMFVQLPLLVKYAPEAWNLPSYMSIAVQIANIAPIFYAICRKFCPNKLNDTYLIYSILFLGIVSPLLMSFFYDHHTYVNGQPRSVVFLILVFVTAIVGCTSSVLFFPYMRYYKETYLISYLIGEGLSGFIPSILALIQGIGGNPECTLRNGNSTSEPIHKDPVFSTQLFFILISVIMAMSFTAFTFLNNLNTCKSERVSFNKKPNIVTDHKQDYSLDEVKTSDRHSDNLSVSSVASYHQQKGLSILRSTNLLLLMSFVCAFGNGIFPSIQSYSCLPYGNTAYHLSVTLSSMANPLACFLAVFLPHTSNRSVSILASICSLFIAYVLATSVLSPMPPMVDTVEGIVIIVMVWIAVVGLVSYIKLCISTIFRSEGGSWMFYCGSASQLGSAVGSLIIFFLINYTEIFVANDPCK